MRTRCCLPIVILGIAVTEVAPRPNMRAEYATSRRSNVVDAQPESGLDSFASAMICRWIQSQVTVQGGVEKVVSSNRVYYTRCRPYIPHVMLCSVFGLVIVAVLALLDFLTFARAGCCELNPGRLKT